MNPVIVEPGESPVILAFPHCGTYVPPEIADRLNERGAMLTDTDWHVDRLYAGLLPDVTTVKATFHRYVIDANRPPDGQSLYPGQATTGLVPETDFDGNAIWRAGYEADVGGRVAAFHAPYHAALEAESARIKARHGVAVLYDCHSIRSHVPRLFEGRLPDFNIGTNDGASCSGEIEAAVATLCRQADGFTSVLNGRFKGGWTTRHYGRPETGIHAIQMELAQSTHLASETPPFDYDERWAARIRIPLAAILKRLEALALGGALTPSGDRR